MGTYNPHAPRIIGQEWVPIKEEPLILAPDVNSTEVGHRFTITANAALQEGRFYISEFPPGMSSGATVGITIYPAGTEDQTGPISRVLIPCNNGGITGAGASFSGATIAAAVASPSDFDSVTLGATGIGTAAAQFFFASNSYAALLTGKRILDVNILYSLSYDIFNTDMAEKFFDRAITETIAKLSLNGPGVTYGGSDFSAGNVLHLVALGTPDSVFRLRLGECNPFWDPSGFSPFFSSERAPWTYQGLQRFEASATNRIFSHWSFANLEAISHNIHIEYVALEVFYCEEKRVSVGMQAYANATAFAFTTMTRPLVIGANPMPLRTLSGNQALNPTLIPGDYDVLVSAANTGDLIFINELVDFAVQPPINALRELYAIPPHPGIQTNVPFPISDSVGETLTVEQIHVLPQLSLHISGGAPLIEPHVYGRQAVAQVYGTVTATQEIQDGLAGGSASWPWVRYVARRFGDTVVPLTLTGAGQSVAITPGEFDELDEILDGWKEITLRFVTPPTMGSGTQPQFVWSAAGETAGNRWEILGACAPALSGAPGNLYKLAPSINQLSVGTYGQPVSGASINLGWIPQGVGSPPVSGTADDQTSDAFIIFGQDMPAVSGFTVTTLSQAITGIGQDCGVDPCCIPTDILYNHIGWTPFGVSDDFDVDGTNGWPPTDTGQTWTSIGGAASDYSVSAGVGRMSFGAVNTFRAMFFSGALLDSDIVTTFTVPEVPTGASFFFSIDMRNVALTDLVRAKLEFTTANTVTLLLEQAVASVFTNIAGPITVLGVTATTPLKIRAQASGTIFRAKVWAASQEEPSGWTLSGTTSVVVASNTLLLVTVPVGVTNALPLVFTFDNLTSTPFVNDGFGYLELQRMDTVETDWQTIMKSTSDNIPTGFNDYEARVGILSSYRIRAVDVYDFPGPWSSTLSVTIPSPGVSGGCLEDGHVLIFTSNEVQDGSINLAYSSVWMDQQVSEDFTFPESGFVQLQLMYNKDFYTAFRPLERGGERFSRTVLVQAAAIAPETLADFRSLRDMAWDTVNYICVRDEDGNRWLATVLVPAGRVLRDRRLYLAPVDIIEVTNTPTPVNP